MIPYQPSRAIGVRAPGALGAPRVGHANNRPAASHTASATNRANRSRQIASFAITSDPRQAGFSMNSMVMPSGSFR